MYVEISFYIQVSSNVVILSIWSYSLFDDFLWIMTVFFAILLM
jgi:hypothetical protein